MRALLGVILTAVVLVAFQNCGGSQYSFEPKAMNSLLDHNGAMANQDLASQDNSGQAPQSNEGSSSSAPMPSSAAAPTPSTSSSSASAPSSSTVPTPVINKVTYTVRKRSIMPMDDTASGARQSFTSTVLFDASGDISQKVLYYCVAPSSQCGEKDFKVVPMNSLDIQNRVVQVPFIDQDNGNIVFPRNGEFLFPASYSIWLKEKVNGALVNVGYGKVKGADCGSRTTGRGGFITRRGESYGYTMEFRMENRSSNRDSCNIYGKLTVF